MAEQQDHLRSDEDVEAILRLAVRRGGTDGAADLRERLQTTAAELGISPEDLAAAEEDYQRAKGAASDWTTYLRLCRAEFAAHAAWYAIVNGFLFAVNLLTSPGRWWVVWPILGWGIALAVHAWYSFGPVTEEREREFARWKKRRDRRKGLLPPSANDEP